MRSSRILIWVALVLVALGLPAATAAPHLSYSSYLGGSGFDAVSAVRTDGAGNIYLAGITTSSDFPVVRATQASSGGLYDAFLVKLDPSGRTILFSTFFGGAGVDVATGLDVRADGMAYITGWTTSFDLPTTPGAWQSVRAPCPNPATCGHDAFVAAFDSSAGRVIYATYFGGSGDDRAMGIRVDPAGDAYIVGDTVSKDLPTVNAYQSALAGGRDAFVTELSPMGDRLLFSTYLGGDGDDGARAVALDGIGSVYVLGWTFFSNFPIVNPFQATNAGGSDLFVAKLTPGGGSLAYSTYLGGSADDEPFDISVDFTGAAIIVGSTGSGNFPTKKAFQPKQAASSFDAFVAKLSPAGNSLEFSTFLGGTRDDAAYGVALTSSGNAWIGGGTTSLDFPTAAPVQSALAGGTDAFLAELDASGSSMPFSTFLGGTKDDNPHALVVYGKVALDRCERPLVAGTTKSPDFPVTPGALQATFHKGDGDMFLAFYSGAEMTCPPDASIECPESTDPSRTGTPAISGFCGVPSCTFVDAAIPGCGGTADVARTWTCSAGIDLLTCSQRIHVVDTTAPVIASASFDNACLWPPNHDFYCIPEVAKVIQASDACDSASLAVLARACTSSQPDNSIGDGDFGPDCVVTNGGKGVCLRSERQGTDPAGRTYTVMVSATDGCGNASTRSFHVTVPHDQAPRQSCLRPNTGKWLVGSRPRPRMTTGTKANATVGVQTASPTGRPAGPATSAP